MKGLVVAAVLVLMAVAPGMTVAQTDPGIPLDIHVVPDSSTLGMAVEASEFVQKTCPGDQVHLGTTDNPHVTLYLTNFQTDSVADVVSTLEMLVPATAPCTAELNGTLVLGSYGMWTGVASPCLQQLSDAVVNLLYKYAVPNQPVPAWVKNLPEPERSEKEALVKKYGSPNVFSQFQPHITLAWDDATPPCLPSAFQELPIAVHHAYAVASIALSHTGPYGTVLANGTIIDIPVNG